MRNEAEGGGGRRDFSESYETALLPSTPTGHAGCLGWGEASALQYVDGEQVIGWPMLPQIPEAGLRAAGSVFAADAVSTVPTAVSNGINGRPSLRFSHAAGNGMLAQTAGLYRVGGITVAMVAQFDNVLGVGVDQVLFRATTPGGVGGDLLSIGLTSGAWRVGGKRLDADAFASFAGIPAVAAATTYLIHVGFDYANAIARLWINGTLVSTINPFQTVGLTEMWNFSAPTLLGASSGRPNDSADALVSYWSLWRRYHDKTALSTLLPAVATRYGITYIP